MTDRKRICIIAHSHPRLRSGGGEVAAYRQYLHLRGLGEDAWFVGATVGDDGTRIMGGAQRMIFFSDHDICLRGDGMDGFVMEQDSLTLEDEVLRLLVRIDADIYHFHHMWNIGAGTIRRLRAAKPDATFVFTVHELIAICANHGQMIKTTGELCYASGPIECSACMAPHSPLTFFIRAARMRELLDLFDVLISPSAFLRDRLEAWGLPSGRVHVLENGMDCPDIAPIVDPVEAETLSRRFAFFGNATPTKGLDVLVRAASLLDPATRVRIEVNGVAAADFARLWPEIEVPDCLVFKGRYQPSEAVAIIRRQGYVLVPSVWWENSPVVIEEAKAARRPVIASDIGGMAEKTAGWGLQFRVGDPDSLAGLIAGLAGDGPRLAAMSAAVPSFQTSADFDRAWRHIVGLAALPEDAAAAVAAPAE